MDKKKNSDPRFAQAIYDPRFDKMHIKQKKVVIDDRFKAIVDEKEKFDNTKDLYLINNDNKE